ncbi:hypothetical protein [Selenomonas ruminantium]|uniref:hypothetical protein n=1 Tax=Selenomonas ruminantium TaxID=971 RepID=UPI0026EEA2DE|nr:hypothetical protein [Selenomonas ruminantium]
MVRGIEKFKEYFQEYANQYVLIGGTACDISFSQHSGDFRATRDLDVVLIVEALTPAFGERFWQFIHDGGYQNRAKSSGQPQFYRFDKPSETEFPSMIELFARTDFLLEGAAEITPLHIDDNVYSLSAILLNEAYYQALLSGREIIDGLSILKPSWIIPFKAKAWLDLSQRAASGMHVDSRDLKKHRNDIIRLAAEFVLERCELPDEVKTDMEKFVGSMGVTDAELKSLRIRGVKAEEIQQLLVDTYL